MNCIQHVYWDYYIRAQGQREREKERENGTKNTLLFFFLSFYLFLSTWFVLVLKNKSAYFRF